MSAWKATGMPILASALIYLIILRATGELHASSNALQFFLSLWIVQSTMTLGQAWYQRRPAPPSIGTAPPGDTPPHG
jgi:hypothetical protein